MTKTQLNELIEKEFGPIWVKYAAYIKTITLPCQDMLELLTDLKWTNPLYSGVIQWAHVYGVEKTEAGVRYLYLQTRLMSPDPIEGDIHFVCSFSVKNPGKQTPKTKPPSLAAGSLVTY